MTDLKPCPSCREPLDHPSGDGCANMTAHKERAVSDFKPDWENFAKAVLSDWPTNDLDGSVLFDLSLQYGMIKEVPGGYTSEHHFDNDGICPEEGDPWYEYTFGGEAGPGLYSIAAITEQLAAAQHDAKEAEAYAEEVEKERDDLSTRTEALRNTNRRLNRRVQLLEGWWQRRLERANYWRGIYLWGMRRKDFDVKAIEEAAYQRGYEDGFEEKFRMPKRWARQPRRINSGESHD